MARKIRSLGVLLSIIACLTVCFGLMRVSENKTFAENNNYVINSTFECTEMSFLGTTVYTCDNWSINDNAVHGNYYLTFTGSTPITSDPMAVPENVNYTYGVSVMCATQSNVKIDVIEEVAGESVIVATTDLITVNDTGGNWQTVSGTFYKAGGNAVRMRITGDVDVSVDDAFIKVMETRITLNDGAYLCLQEDSKIIKFRGCVDKEFYDNLLENYQDVEVGVLVTSLELLQSAEHANNEFTEENLITTQTEYTFVTALEFVNTATSEIDGHYVFDGVFSYGVEDGIDKVFIARATVKYTDENGETVRIYADYDQTKNSRSIREIALKAYEEKQLYGDLEQEIIEYFCTVQ